MKLFINFILSTIAAFVCILILPGLGISSYYTAILAALILGVINISIKPLLAILDIVPTFLTILASLFFFNGIVVVVMDWTIEGFTSESTWSVILFSALLSLFNWGIHKLIWQNNKVEKK